MRVVVTFLPASGKLILPIHYNRAVQGMIYAHLDPSLARWVHDRGTPLGKRAFKFFTFSRLFGRCRLDGERIRFEGHVRVHIGSVFTKLLESLVKNLLKTGAVQLGDEEVGVVGIEVEELPTFGRPVKVRALSPITIYSTLSTFDDRRKTYYWSPQEGDWERKILENLARKAMALGWPKGKIAELEGARIRPLRVRNRDLKILRYGDTVIKGWLGLYELDLPEPFFRLAYDAGLGAKNSQGFGMVEVIRSKK